MGLRCSKKFISTNFIVSRTIITKKQYKLSLRDKVWIAYHGEKLYGSCYSCGKIIYRYGYTSPKSKSSALEGWQCSHVIAKSKGGPNTISNLRVCCRHCNLSMGNQNLYVYMKHNKMKGPGKKNIYDYLKKYPCQINDIKMYNRRME